MVADDEDLQKMDASEIHGKRLDAKEVLTPMRGDKFTFPTIKLSGGDLRTSTLIRTAQTEEKNKIIFQENQTDLLQHHLETHRGIMVKLEMISGPFHAILFTVVTWNPESNCTRREKNHFLFH